MIISINSLISNDFDPDGDELVVNLLTSPEEGLLTDLGDGELKYTPTTDFSGVLDFEYFYSKYQIIYLSFAL